MLDTFLDKAAILNREAKPYATAIIVRRKVPSSGKPGDKAIITPDGKIHGWIGGGCTKGIVLKEAMASLKDKKPRLVNITPEPPEGQSEDIINYTMTCQSRGEVEVYIEPVLPKPQILIFGKSHIARAIATVAKAIGYRVHVVMSTIEGDVFPEVDSLIELADFKGGDGFRNSYIVVCTQGESDAQALAKAVSIDTPYISFVASRRKAAAIFAEARQLGVKMDQLKKVKSPAGIDIGAKLHEEVAVSILAEIIREFRANIEAAANSGERVSSMPNDEYYVNPVCQIPVQKSTAKHIIEYGDEKVYFCCDGCKVSFEKDPEKYMSAVHA